MLRILLKILIEPKKYTKALGLDYVKIDAWINHRILYQYQKENKNLDKCPKCYACRWKEIINTEGDSGIDTCSEDCTKVGSSSRLVHRHFSLIPRLKRIFMSSILAEYTIWHTEKHSNNGKMRHLVSPKAWIHLDELYPNFASNSRNIRLTMDRCHTTIS